LKAVGFWEEREHPTEGKVRVARFPGTWSKTQPDIRRLAPNLGEHDLEVLSLSQPKDVA
jgi:crotonobetainyl-CoA:carnitine CoA-transferase CaiB-like acyl-CoA transferase